jgi:hypothetical protein
VRVSISDQFSKTMQRDTILLGKINRKGMTENPAQPTKPKVPDVTNPDFLSLETLDQLADDSFNAIALVLKSDWPASMAGTHASGVPPTGVPSLYRPGQGTAGAGHMLLGAAEALRNSLGNVKLPYERQEYEREVTMLREGMDAQLLEIAWNVGKAMALDEEVDYALSETDQRVYPASIP